MMISPVLKHPRLKYCYRAEFLPEGRVLLLSEKDSALLTGSELTLQLLARIREDGATLENLVTQLEDRYSPVEILSGLQRLEADGFITAAAPVLPPGESAYWSSTGLHPAELQKVLEEKPVSLEFPGEFPAEVFIKALSAAGIRIGEHGALRVVIVSDYEQTVLRHINRQALDTGQPWMLVKPYGVELWLGPIFVPGQTGCWDCLRQRLRNHRPMNTFFQYQKKTQELPGLPPAYLPLSLQTAANMTALEIIKWLYPHHPGKSQRQEGILLTCDTYAAVTRRHILVKRPQCPTCGEEQYKESKPPSPIILRKRAGRCIRTAGGYREVSPEHTVKKYRHHISPVTGVVQWLKPYCPARGAPVYNYSSGPNVALQSKSLFWLNYHSRGVNGGKGRNRQQAKAGAICEAIERYSSTYQGDEYEITGSLQELGREALHPNRCMNYSQDQYRQRDEINKDCRKFYQLVPRPFDETLKMGWTPVYSLTQKVFKYLPSCFCYAQYPGEDPLNLFAYPDSSGCAAGNSPEEAILQGFLELVERDSVALWWYNKLAKPAVDLRSFNDPYFLRLINYYNTLRRRLHVLDLTADMQIPVFGAISYLPHEKKQEVIFGFGAHVEAKIALERALVELNQILPTLRGPGTDKHRGRYRTKDDTFIHWLETAALEDQPYLAPDEKIPLKKASDYPPLCPANIYDSLGFCLDKAAEQGLETLVLDLTRPDIGLPVVKVMVPGLRHFWRRLAPGRLYDVPVKMGWLREPLAEDELNPLGLFI